MLNYLWEIIIIIGISFGLIMGKAGELGTEVLEGSNQAVELVIYMCGIVAMWSGFMEVARKAGITARLSKMLSGVIAFLYPGVEKNSQAAEYIAINMTANMLGLGWAATPTGLLAIKEMKKSHDKYCRSQLELAREKGIQLTKKQKRRLNPDAASNDMCTLLIINISSLQLIPINIIAYRSKYGSVNPAAIVGAVLFATIFSTLVGVLYARIMDMATKCSSL